jgi:hypothetical protein
MVGIFIQHGLFPFPVIGFNHLVARDWCLQPYINSSQAELSKWGELVRDERFVLDNPAN